MARKILWLFVGFSSFVAVALEYFPLQVVHVQPGTPAPVTLAVGTPAELAPLEFVLVDPPKHGMFLGTPPNLVYVPQSGFVGTDWATFLVQTAEGELLDLGTVQLRVLGPAETLAPALRFEGTLNFPGPGFSVDSYSFLFGLYARFQYLDTQVLATWDQTGFSSFQSVAKIELEGTWPGAWRLPITSTLTFNPTTPSLTSWTVDARTLILGWNLSYYFYYSGTDPQTNSYATLTVQGYIDRISLTSCTKFATLAPTFAEEVLTLRGPWLCTNCPITWEAEYMFTKLGFQHLAFTLRDVEIPCPGCGPIRTYLDAKITFTTEEKKVEPTLRLAAGIVACVRPLVELVTAEGGFGLAGFRLYGVELRCELPQGYKGRFATSFDPTKDSTVTGYTQFFEVIQFEGPVVPCCGAPGWWQLFFYFQRAAGALFGLGMTDIIVYFPISTEVLLNARLKTGLVDLSNPTKTWIFTWGWKALF